MTTCFRANISDNNTTNNNSSSGSGGNHLRDKWRSGQIEVMINGAQEDEILDTKEPSRVQHKGEASEGDVETWDDAFDFDSPQPFEHILEQLQHTFPRSPLSDVSDQSDYFQPAAAASSAPITIKPTGARPPSSSYTHALPSPPSTTTATTLTSSKGTQAIPTFSSSNGCDGGSVLGSSHSNIRRLVGTTDALLKVDARGSFHSSNYSSISNNNDKASALPPLAPTFQARNGSSSKFLSLPPLPSTTSSPSSSASSSPRAITASVGVPSTAAASTRSTADGYSRRDSNDKGKGRAQDRSEEENFCPVLSTTSMTTITQEMMLSSLPAYTGIITRINPIKRVAAWVDDLEDLEVPEEDLNFNQVRSILAKSSSVPDTLESIETWDTDSERSTTQSEDPLGPSPRTSWKGERIQVENVVTRKCSIPTSETIETLDEDFDLSENFGPLQLRLPPHPHLHDHVSSGNLSRKQSSLLRWQDLGSELDENDLENRSLSSSGSLSRVSLIDEDLLDGIVFPESMDNLRLVTDRPYRPERDPSVFGKESRMQEDDPEKFWDGLEIGEDSFNLQGRNKHLFVRPVMVGRERSSSRVRREVVPLKDFVALPSRIPRLCRAPGDTSRPVTPAPSLSRMHSTQFDLPLRHLNSKSSLPRLKRSSISRREGSRVKQTISTANPHARIISSELGTSVTSTPYASRAPTPTAIHIPGSKRNSLGNVKDDFPSLGASSLIMRTVSFTKQPAGPVETPAAAESTTVLPSMPISLRDSPAPVQTQGSGRVFPTLRMLVRKLDLGRPRLSAARGLIPAFGQMSSPEPVSSVPADLIVSRQSAIPSVHPLASPPPHSPSEAIGDTNLALKHPSNSRSSSFTDWGSVFGSPEAAKENRLSSRVGPASLGDISEFSTTDFTGDIITGAFGQAVATEKFSRRVFLKRSPKQSMFGDGSELDRFDNLPTVDMNELPLTGNENEIDRVKALHYKRQSTDRVAMWLRKSQSIVDIKEAAKPIEVARTAESEGSSSSIIRKTKSIRRSLFDIFTQVTQAAQPTPIAPVVQPPPAAMTGRKKKRTSSGPTLIRDLSLQTKVRRVSGMVYNPKDKMWDGNDDILDDFEDEDAEVAAATSAFASPATSPRQFEFPGSPLSHAYFPNSPLMGTASMSAVNRPALITNMNQHSKPRMQVAGKMVFDPTRMCWIVNPEYILRRKQQQQRRRHGHGDHARQRSMDEAWGDEPDVFAGLSESDKSQDEDELQNEVDLNEREDWERVGTTGTNSHSRSNTRRLLSRPSFQRQPSHDCVAEQERLQAWAETMALPGAASHDSADPPRSVGGGFHSVIPKSSRRSLNGHHGTCSGGVGSIGGGNNSRGEFEVGIEFDITDAFLEQCIAAEALHRKGAGRFFALPCSPIGVLQPPAAVATTGRLSKMTPSNMISLGRKSGKATSRGKDEGTLEGRAEVIDAKEGEKKDIATNDREREVKERKLSFPTNPLMSWPPRSKGKSRSKSIQALLLSDGSNPMVHSSGQPMGTGLTGGNEQSSTILRRNSEGSVAVLSKGGSDKAKNKGKDKTNDKSTSRSFSKANLLPFFKPNNDASRSPAATVVATLAARGRGGSREMFFHRPVRQEGAKRGTLSFAATLAAARRGGHMPFDRRKIGADTFDPLCNSQCIDGQHERAVKDGRSGKLEIGEQETEEEEEDTVERGYRIMPSSRGRPPLRPRAELLLEFERHGQRYR